MKVKGERRLHKQIPSSSLRRYTVLHSQSNTSYQDRVGVVHGHLVRQELFTGTELSDAKPCLLEQLCRRLAALKAMLSLEVAGRPAMQEVESWAI